MLIKPDPVKHPIPHEPGEWMNLIRLSAKQIRKAKKVREHEDLETVRVLGAEFAKAMQDDDEKDPVVARKKRKKALERLKEFRWDLSNYDPATLLKLALPKKGEAWSYAEPPGDDPADQIDVPTLEWAAQAVIDLARGQRGGEEKNSSGRSTQP